MANKPPKPPAGMDAFGGLLANISKVPKTELEGQIKKYEAAKAKKAAKKPPRPSQ